MYNFEYNKQGYLYQYSEILSGETIFNYSVNGNKIIRYEKEDEYKCLEEYYSKVKLLQRFEAGESWLTVCIDDSIELEEYSDDLLIQRKYPDFYSNNQKLYPELKKRIQIENNNIIEFKSTVQRNLVNHWKSLVNL